MSGGNLRALWRRKFSDRSDIYLQAFWSHDHRIGSNFGEDRDTFDVDFLHRLAATRFQQFTYGLGIRLSPSTVSQTIPTDTFTPLHKTDSIYSAFLQEELRLVPDRLSLTLGSKFEHNNYTGFEYQPNARLLLRLRRSSLHGLQFRELSALPIASTKTSRSTFSQSHLR